MNRICWIIIFVLTHCLVSAQDQAEGPDTIFHIREVAITTSRLDNFSMGNKVQRIDSTLLKSFSTLALSQTLSSCSGIQMNSYGTGMSNASLRGTGSSHTAVIWNGFNIQDILNGGVDFSLIPSGFFDQVKIQYGGNGALFGSGCIGGAIHLDNSLDFQKGFNATIRSSLASFLHIYEGADLSWSNAQFSGFIKGYFNSAKNNFSFKNTEEFGYPVQTMKHNEVTEGGIIAGSAIRLNSNQRVDLNFWYLNNDKNIGPTMTTMEGMNGSNNKVHSFRTAASWKYRHNKTNATLRSGFFNNHLLYTPQNVNLEIGDHRSVSWVNESELNYRFSEQHFFNLGLNYTLEKGISSDLIDNPKRNRYSVFASYRFTDRTSLWRFVTSVREELINKLFTPFTFTMGLERQLNQDLILKGKVSRNFRLPSFNDLYWKGWGNPLLRSESGFGQDLGLCYSKKEHPINYTYDLSFFSNVVNDWILWHPNADNTWSPDNISRVWARGIEQDLTFIFQLANVSIKPSLFYSYTKSTKIKEDFEGDEAYHKQLTYVPEHKAGITTLLEYKGIQLFYSQKYMGKRYTLANNSKQVASVFLGDISVSKEFPFGNQSLSFSFFVNNLWNTPYQVIQYYPCPLRNYQISLQLNLK